MSSTNNLLQSIVQSQKRGQPLGIYSICSANRFVLEAAMLQALADDSAILIESTSNQVNQFGGYTGMTAGQFRDYVATIARDMKFPRENIILGGDHLGPNAWQKDPARIAMEKSIELVRSCVMAGYTKIHLDASMRCADDPGDAHTPLAEKTVTERAAAMCAAAEEAHAKLPKGSPAPVYIVGTEVPIPGGEQASHTGIAVTATADAERTIAVSRAAFAARNLENAWQRVIGVVVQPGVEFGDASVFPYDRPKAKSLSKLIEKYDTVVYEAHSTDYQTESALKQLVEDHFAILKVGPWLTFALREAIFALAEIEKELLANRPGITLSRIKETLEEVMQENPNYWKPYYHGNESAIALARKFSYSDRSRYYWPTPKLAAALDRLINNLKANPTPPTLLSQYLPNQYEAVRAGKIKNDPEDLIRNKIMEVTGIYARACAIK